MKIWKGIAIVVALVVTNLLVHQVVVRWDMTNDRRYSIAPTTKALLQELNAPLQVTILLDGELNAGFQRLQRATVEIVEELEAARGERLKAQRLTIGCRRRLFRKGFHPPSFTNAHTKDKQHKPPFTPTRS